MYPLGSAHDSRWTSDVFRDDAVITNHAPERVTSTLTSNRSSGSVEDQYVRRGIGAQRVRPHLVRSIDSVGAQIQIRCRIRAPPATGEGRLDDTGQVRTGPQVAEPQAVPLVADDVVRPGQHSSVGAHLELAAVKLGTGMGVGNHLQVDHRFVRTVVGSAHQGGEFGPRRVDFAVGEDARPPGRRFRRVRHPRRPSRPPAWRAVPRAATPRLVVGAFGVEQIDQLRRRLGDPAVRVASVISGPRDRRREGGVSIAAG